MAKGFVSIYEFHRYIINARFGKVTSESIARYCNFLEGKDLKEDGKNDKCAEHEFLSQATKMSDASSHYSEEIEKYIKSRDFLNKIKRWILNVINNSSEFDLLREKLNTDTDINDYSVQELQLIDKALRTCSSDDELLAIFERYMFVLDGTGPANYIRSLYPSEQDLALEFLNKSNVEIGRKTDCDGLLIEYIMAIYRMYHKYLPQYENNYYKLIEFGGFLSLDEFVLEYKEFVNSGFEIEDSYKFDEKSEDKERIITRQVITGLLDKARVSLSGSESLEIIIKRLIYTPKRPNYQQGLDKSA